MVPIWNESFSNCSKEIESAISNQIVVGEETLMSTRMHANFEKSPHPRLCAHLMIRHRLMIIFQNSIEVNESISFL